MSQPSPAPSASQTTTRPRILVVDDDAALARIVAFVLRDEGFSVEVTNDGDTGLSLAQANRPDAVVLDLRMPGKDGRTVFRELRSLGIDSPVLILSAYDARQAAQELSAQGYLNKPFEPERLAEALRRIITS